jgi:hypothetical protein
MRMPIAPTKQAEKLRGKLVLVRTESNEAHLTCFISLRILGSLRSFKL